MTRRVTSREFYRSILLLLAMLSLLITAGCKTTAIGAPNTIEVPAGLTANDADVAIIALLTAPPASAPEYDAHSDTQTFVLANPIGAMLWDRYRHRSRQPVKHWFVESYAPGRTIVGFRNASQYMNVSIESTQLLVSLRIVSSKNLQQTDTQIHKHAKVWLDRLEVDIRDALGTASLVKANLVHGK